MPHRRFTIDPVPDLRSLEEGNYVEILYQKFLDDLVFRDLPWKKRRSSGESSSSPRN